MKKTFTLLLILLSQFCYAQNLVPNPSFEQYDTCPNNLAQITRAIGWSSYSITPDYFNSCAPDSQIPSVSVPLNAWGYQNANIGSGYAGIIVFNRFATNSREFIGIQLSEPLTVGQRYIGSFYVSRAKTKNPGYNIATNKIGLRLSTVSYSSSKPAPKNNFAHVFSDSIIIDTLDWIKISGSFIADSPYNYLAIGNFFTDAFTSYIAFDSSSAGSIYYVDDVYLYSDSINWISNYENDFIKTYPNPARDWIVVEGRNISKYSLYDVLGKLCFSKEVSYSSLEKIDVSFLEKGMYFIRIETSTENTVRKIIIQ